MIALKAYLGLIVQQLNIIKAYLNGLLPEKKIIYIIMLKRLYIKEKLKKFCKLL